MAAMPASVCRAFRRSSEALSRVGIVALVAAALVMTAAIVKLARVEAVATRDGVQAELHEEAGLPA
jgi:hypothetical protein